MKISIASILLGAIAAVSEVPVIIGNLGFNIGHTLPDGSCKTTANWLDDFRAIKSWSHGNIQITTIRLFSTADCANLRQAIPAAQATGIKIWATLWAVPHQKFIEERKELKHALETYGNGWLAGVNVGSEHLYRGDISPEMLSSHIREIKHMVQVMFAAPYIAVGCADTWTNLVAARNRVVVEASDVILANGFPYWQGMPIESAGSTFIENMSSIRNMFPGKPFIIGETGWPTEGASFGGATTSVKNLQRYWTATVCPYLAQGIPFFWFSAFDEPQKTGDNGIVEKHFGAATVDRRLKIQLEC